MNTLAKTIEYLQPVLECCLVVNEKDGRWTVAAGKARYGASLALSCLVRPEINDTVLVSLDQGGSGHILSILERPDQKGMLTTLSLNGQVNLEVKNGALRVAAGDGIAFSTPQKLSMTSADLEINARQGKASIESFSFLAGIFYGQIEKVRIVADALDSIFRRAVQRFVSSYRYIEEHEEISRLPPACLLTAP